MIYKSYVKGMESIKRQFGIKLEAEILSGEIFKYSRHNKKKRRVDSKNRLTECVNWLKTECRSQFEQDLYTEQDYKDKASACYVAAYVDTLPVVDPNFGEINYYGFPWFIAPHELLSLVEN